MSPPICHTCSFKREFWEMQCIQTRSIGRHSPSCLRGKHCSSVWVLTDFSWPSMVNFSCGWDLMWLSLAPTLAGYQLSFGHPSLIHSIIGWNSYNARWIWIWPANVARTLNKVKFPPSNCPVQSGAPHAAVCGRCAVTRCLDRSQPLLWPTFSVWCLALFINPESVTVAQKPEMAVEGRGSEGEGMTGNIMLNLCYCVKRSLSHEWLITCDKDALVDLTLNVNFCKALCQL